MSGIGSNTGRRGNSLLRRLTRPTTACPLHSPSASTNTALLSSSSRQEASTSNRFSTSSSSSVVSGSLLRRVQKETEQNCDHTPAKRQKWLDPNQLHPLCGHPCALWELGCQ